MHNEIQSSFNKYNSVFDGPSLHLQKHCLQIFVVYKWEREKCKHFVSADLLS